jgi:hypothetical protein
MSLVHRLIVGHFDIDAFHPGRPVPLRALDDRRTRAMLDEIGKQTGEDEYEVDGEPLYFVDRYCDCPWLSNKRNERSEKFARAVATIEDCFLIEKGVGTLLHPVRSLQWVPSAHRSRAARRSDPLSRDEADAITRGEDPADLCRAVLRAGASEGDWVEGFCGDLAKHGDFHVRGNALFAIAMLASRGRMLTRERIQPIVEEALADSVPYVSGQARVAAEAVERRLRWVIRAFDNGNPEREVRTYSNGWIRCPNCGWRFATYDPWAFREGRCMECRQRLRVIN